MKTLNTYVSAMSLELYEDCPKAVLAAIAVSALTIGGDQLDKAAARIAQEWQTLHAAGVVAQPPTKQARDLLAQHARA
jgi:hypothetical protein